VCVHDVHSRQDGVYMCDKTKTKSYTIILKHKTAMEVKGKGTVSR